jgi:cytochrome c553
VLPRRFNDQRRERRRERRGAGPTRSWRVLVAGVALLPPLVVALLPHAVQADTTAETPFTAEMFTERIAPLLATRCGECHGADTQEGSLRLDSREGLASGGGTGPVIVPRASGQSLLVQAIRRVDESLAMPPDAPLPQDEVDLIAAWIDAGAPHPDGPLEVAPTAPDRSAARDHWAFRPLVVPQLPEGTASHPVDRFLEAGLAAAGLAPTPPTEPATLVRRLSFDLTGLPPEPDLIDAFVADPLPEAVDGLIERLLASPHYGEHWGRHWLDVVRYADSNGLDENVAHGNAWRYRDYVIAAFNADKPFDAFVREQVAGDLLVTSDASPERRAELLTATGFLVLGPKVLAEGDEQKLLMDIIDEQLDTAGKAFLGLAIGCARCHDHKFDPISQADYYALAGIFQSTRTMESLKRIAKWNENIISPPGEVAAHAAHQQSIEVVKQAVQDVVKQTQDALAMAENAGSPATKPAEETFPDAVKAALVQLRAAQHELESTLPQLASAMGVAEAEPTVTPIHLRGSHLTLGREVPRGIPVVLEVDGPAAIPADASGRLQLAEWLTDPRHPLTARVIVNRVWRWHFGRGLVSSTDNFGTTGQPPTNQALLDWLAADLIESGWSLKALHRRILTSDAWQRSSDATMSPTAELAKDLDPDNQLWWRADVRRLEAESIRDALLAVSGKLDRTMGGSLLHVGNREFLFDHTSKDETNYDAPRRSVYLPVIRNHIQDALWLFDCTDGAVPDGDRATSTVASQALWLLNADLPMDAADAIAASAMATAPNESELRTQMVYRRVLGREVREDEAAWLAERVASFRTLLSEQEGGEASGEPSSDREKAAEQKAWAAAVQTLLMSEQFLVVR